MRIAFDTSVLVACSIRGHVHEDRARPWLDAARHGHLEAMASTHALAELWATLTAIPIEPRLAPSLAQRVTVALTEYVREEPILAADYRAAMQRCCDRSVRSGAIYDALHLLTAERVGVDAIVTFDVRHFDRLSVPDGPKVVAPPDPPEVRL